MKTRLAPSWLTYLALFLLIGFLLTGVGMLLQLLTGSGGDLGDAASAMNIVFFGIALSVEKNPIAFFLIIVGMLSGGIAAWTILCGDFYGYRYGIASVVFSGVLGAALLFPQYGLSQTLLYVAPLIVFARYLVQKRKEWENAEQSDPPNAHPRHA